MTSQVKSSSQVNHDLYCHTQHLLQVSANRRYSLISCPLYFFGGAL